jgi:hypothetical protein
MSYSFLKLNNKKKLKNFLKYNWKKNHILSNDDKLLNWQHSYNNNLYFYCLIKKRRIQSALGIINQSRDQNLREIGLGIITSINQMGVFDLLKEFSKKKFKIIKAIGLTKKIIPVYKFFGYKTGKLNIYYSKNPLINKSKISKNLKNFNFSKKISEGINLENINKIIRLKRNKKIKKYLDWRFARHPYYKYECVKSFDKKLTLIFRVIKICNNKFIRIVDFIGSFKNQKKFISHLINFFINKKFHHIEFMHYGHEDKFIKKTDFYKKNDKQKIAIYTEPFDNFKKKNLFFAYKIMTKKKIKIVRADADGDRPNILSLR